VYCFEDDDLREAADMMKREQIRRLAVLNDSKRMVGIITLGDIARADEQRLAGEIELQVAQI
jgi:CBS domain-containing protein